MSPTGSLGQRSGLRRGLEPRVPGWFWYTRKHPQRSQREAYWEGGGRLQGAPPRLQSLTRSPRDVRVFYHAELEHPGAWRCHFCLGVRCSQLVPGAARLRPAHALAPMPPAPSPQVNSRTYGLCLGGRRGRKAGVGTNKWGGQRDGCSGLGEHVCGLLAIYICMCNGVSALGDWGGRWIRPRRERRRHDRP